jgi:glycosyltransferase involved in cell wall biosynthesis
MPRPKLLVVTRHSPLPENDGAGAYLFDLLSHLAAQGAEIEVAWVKVEGELINKKWWRVPSRYNRVARLTIISTLAVGPYRYFRWGAVKARFLGVVKRSLQAVRILKRTEQDRQLAAKQKALRGKPQLPDDPLWSALPTAQERRFFEKRVKAFKPDAVLANFCWMTPLYENIGGVRKLVLAHDVAYQRHQLDFGKAGHAGIGLPAANKEGESRLLRCADTILAISGEDAAAFREMVPDRAIAVVQKSAALTRLGPGRQRGRCLFVGGLNDANLQGLLWFLADVWPLVQASRPDAVLHVCGRICELAPAALPAGVVLRGRVDDLKPEYLDAEVVVVPLLQGTGVKIKLVEACSFGKACVTTAVGLQGLPFLRDGVLEANEPIAFAQAVLRVLDDPSLREELQQRIVARVTENLSPQSCYGPVWNALTQPAASLAAAV